MPTIVSKVKVREILPHLPCLTDHDRENIEAKRETYGNFDSMMLLLDCLKRRENWPEQFIAALEACEHPTIAAEIRAEYEALKGNSRESANSTPSSPQTTVVRAHVHPAPSAIQPPVPESSGNSQAAVSPPAVASAPPEPAVQPSPPPRVPVPPETPPMPAVHVPEEVPPPEPVEEPPKAAQIEVAPPPSTPPPSPATPHLPAAGSQSPHRVISFHPEPEENSESDIQDFPADNGVVSAEVGAGKEDESIGGAAEIPPPSGPVEQSEGGAPACSDFLQTAAAAAEVSPPRSPSPAENDSDMLTDAAVTTMTPEKPPVQDTTPPAAALEPEETTKPQTAQAVEHSPQRETTATVSPLPVAATAADEMDASLSDESSEELLSKPDVLISVQPQNQDDSPTIRASSPPAEPYSGDTGRLEISEAAPDTETLNPAPACSAVSSAAINSVATEPCVENGFANNHNEPEENHYDSPSQSLETQEVLENVVQVHEVPSILNLDGLNLTPQAQTVNGEAAKEIKSSPPAPAEPTETVTDVNTPIREERNSSTEPEPAGLSTELRTVQGSQEERPSRMLQINTKYIVAAAGVGACALLMAWKFKN